jgi:allantoinase
MIVRSTRVIRSAGSEAAPASVHIEGARIVRVDPWHSVPDGAPVMELGDRVVMAGIVDTHVHVNEPGRTEWEGFETATRAAAAGGVTTLMDMPPNSIPATTSVRALDEKRAAAEGQCFVDVGFAGGVVPGNAGELAAMIDAGVLAFKCFLCESGVDEFADVGRDDLLRAMPILADRGMPLLVHAELPPLLDDAAARLMGLSPEDARRYASYLASRPRQAEDAAVELLFELAKETGARAHVVHLSSADALATLRRARDSGVPLGAETCPHYLTFAAEDVPDGATEYKCAPPIREGENRERLWDALREGLIDQVVSDHSPSTPALKCCDSGDFMKAWGGISSLELGLSVVWTGARARGLGLGDVARLLCEAPAALVGLGKRKGRIAAGFDADLVVWEPESARVVEPSALHHRHKTTPYARRTLDGKVHATIVGGRVVYEDGRVVGGPQGRLLAGR